MWSMCLIEDDLSGQQQDGIADGWFGETGDDEGVPEFDVKSVLRSKAGVAIAGTVARLQSRKNNKVSWLRPLTASAVTRLRRQATVSCGDVAPVECRPHEAACLFDVVRDPCERRNLAAEKADTVDALQRLLAMFRSTMVPPRNVPADPMADPALWNRTWSNWRDDDGPVVDDVQPLVDVVPPVMAVAAAAAVLLAAAALRARITNAVAPADKADNTPPCDKTDPKKAASLKKAVKERTDTSTSGTPESKSL